MPRAISYHSPLPTLRRRATQSSKSRDINDSESVRITQLRTSERSRIFTLTWAIGIFTLLLVLGTGVYVWNSNSSRQTEKNNAYDIRDNAKTDLESDEGNLKSLTDIILDPQRSQNDRNFAEKERTFAREERDNAKAYYAAADHSYMTAQARVDRNDDAWVTGAAGSALLAAMAVTSIWYFRKESARKIDNEILWERLSNQNKYTVEFNWSTLWKHNQTQIETYHRLVTNYAESTRQGTQVSLIVGFLFVLTVGIFAITRSGTAAITGSVISLAAAAVTGYIANATLKNAENSAREVRSFFNHPQDVQRALAAERLSDSMPAKEKSEGKLVIIRYLANGNKDAQNTQVDTG
ncbi:hypothetical protein JOJ86_007417 [Rhodococcus percolatus]|uniref:hypothetical protein n=1 Tax=Rhodococcus opacus TaxID=37919 RepID=UPI0015F79457|nr:hypothetical protein [Rhodococcus opacus]MBA8965095.1 hypothetical protein [Rhodococcus opacus]MBP2209624.1 hypothetical protein [Rhodococcus opacus]